MCKKIYFLLIFIVVSQTTIEANTKYLNLSTKKITIYWDTSLSMKDKDIAKEIALLDSFFNNTPSVEVELIVFSNTINLQKSFNIVNTDWSSLKEELLKTTYDGVAFYDVLLEQTTSDINFLFTDGTEVIDKLIINKSTPTFVISSTPKSNFRVLINQSLKSKGKYINLSKITIQQALIKLNIEGAKIIEISRIQLPKQSTNTAKIILSNTILKGIVYGSEGVLVGATIKIDGKALGVVTDDKGKFNLKVDKGNVLIVSFLGKKTKKVVVENSPTLEILLVSDENELDEVVVKSVSKNETINTGFGKTEKKKLGYAVKSINSENLNGAATDVSMSLQGKVGAAKQGQNSDLSQIVFRANSFLLNMYPLIVIDGSPIARSNSKFGGRVELTNFIDPNNIANITILKGLAATNRWGSEGSNGVILITTKIALADVKSKKPYNKALVRDNNFTENLTLVNTSINEKYIMEFKGFKTLSEVYNHYIKQRINYISNPLYFVNISDYISQWGNKELTSKILSNILEIYPEDVTLLKLVAYKAEQQQDFFLAKRIYEKIVKLKPSDSQSYRDLALIYQETANYQEALAIYNDIQNNKYVGVNFSGIQKNIDNEMKRLLLQHKNELDLTGIAKHNLYPKNVDYDARIVFDWNDCTANFDLQFVNPQKKFFTWSHTKTENALRLNDEKTQGYNTEEFLLIESEKGEWQINIESKVPQSKKPIILKYTVYKNYGKASETKESKLLILNNIKEKQMVGKIVI